MRITIAMLSLLVGGCFGEPDPIPGEDDDGAETTGGTGSESGTGPSSGASNSGSGTSVSGTSVDPTSASSSATVGSTTDDSDSMDTGVPGCGALGQDCCEDQACEEGTCWRGICAVFAGMFGEPLTCDGCTESKSGVMLDIPPSFIPFLGGCGCPEGFDASMGLPSSSDYCPADMLLHTNTDVVFCQHPMLYADSDWIGAYATSFDPACPSDGAGCLVRNPYTDECDCPGGSTELLVETVTQCNGDGMGNHNVDIHICIADVEPINFGGAFQLSWQDDPPPACDHGNPMANGMCQCPAGFSQEGLRLTAASTGFGGDLFVCVRY